MTSEKSEYIKNWIFRADEDMAVIEKLIDAGAIGYTSSICFHAQQAVEKYLKAFLIFNGIDFPRTHDLDFLRLECQKIDHAEFDIDLKSLTDFGVSVRYPDDFYVPEEKEALDYYDIAKGIQKIVNSKINI